MSTYYSAVAVYGVYFNGEEEMLKLLSDNNVEDYSDELVVDELGFTYLSRDNVFLFGIKMELGVLLSHYQAIWDKLLPNSVLAPKPILEVDSY